MMSAVGGLLRGIHRLALAGMLLYVAIQHALLAASLERVSDRAISVAVALVTLLSGNLGIGFALGVAVVLGRRAVASLVGARLALDPGGQV